ncbi:Sugar kinase of the NBD/HSP70 family, may contain an N-terminal HTH domain [Sphingomonas sp. NFR04]|uniref:ROK family transcriptional regulator n=1 Tax=Sphingomonas sp. NFR04 TaxID=1566283 RepID=UPI0008E8AD86|nr:ROK family transcriptional regulator [Sphingomonas sp. NFR04]SFK07375.1 Sugar kinase of the NBD/HSP70 family, may contain an N-terminal HTH domain [Sphingomonas sp. NFR04]
MMRKGTNAGGMRRYNQRLILAAVRRMNGASKAELARMTALSPQAVVRIVDELEEEGLLFQAAKRTGGMGQPATIYRINGKRGYTVGVEVGRGDTTIVLLDFDGDRKAVCRHADSFPSINTVVRHVEHFIDEQLASGNLLNAEVLMGIGIAMPWFLGEWRDELGLSADQADAWRRADVADRLQAGFGWPVFFENDGNAAALAQLLCGAGVDLQDFLAINIGTFVGGGLVLGGRVHQGRHGNAGALASMPVCAAGKSDFLVHRASLYALGQEAAADARLAWIEQCIEALAFAVTSANSLLDLEAVIIDGSLDLSSLETIADGLRSHFSTDAPPDFFAPEIRTGALGAAAGAVGAGLLPLHASFTPDLASLFKKG